METFWLGTHMPHWLAKPRIGHARVPLFVSHRRLNSMYLNKGRRLPVAVTEWCCDSGGFSELDMFGGWKTRPEEYVEAVHLYDTEIGMLRWAAPMDWMCEQQMLDKTGLTVREHQHRTVDNYVDLVDRWRRHVPDRRCPFIPVVQGQTPDDYLWCVELYDRAGVDLAAMPIVGVGSVCRRQNTQEIYDVIRTLAAVGMRMHAFGVKTLGLARYAPYVVSTDSMAWSARGRREPGCTPTHKTEANCLDFALGWRQDLLAVAAMANRKNRQTDLLYDFFA